MNSPTAPSSAGLPAPRAPAVESRADLSQIAEPTESITASNDESTAAQWAVSEYEASVNRYANSARVNGHLQASVFALMVTLVIGFVMLL